MNPFSNCGCTDALRDLNLLNKTSASKIYFKQGRDPFKEIEKKINKVFKIKQPKFDLNALIKRLLKSPFTQPQKHLSGNIPKLKV